MDVSKLENVINDAWDNRENIDPSTKGEVRESVEDALNGLDLSLIHI